MTSSAGIDSLVTKGRVLDASKVDVRLGAADGSGAAMPDITTPDALRAILRAASAVASIDPNGGATSGPFIDQLFERLGVADMVRGKGVLCAAGSDVVRAVASGRASIGITQAAELIGLPGLACRDRRRAVQVKEPFRQLELRAVRPDWRKALRRKAMQHTVSRWGPAKQANCR